MGIYVGPRVLGLAVFGEDARHDVVQLLDESEEGVVGQVLEGEFLLGGVARIGLPQHSVAVTGDHLARVQDVPELLLQFLVVDVLPPKLLPQLQDEAQHLLIGQAMQRPSETGHTACEGKIRIG